MMRGWSTWHSRRSQVFKFQSRPHCSPSLPTISRLPQQMKVFFFLMRPFCPFYLPFPFQAFSWCLAELSPAPPETPSGNDISKGSKAIPHHCPTLGVPCQARLLTKGTPSITDAEGDSTIPQGAGGGQGERDAHSHRFLTWSAAGRLRAGVWVLTAPGAAITQPKEQAGHQQHPPDQGC